MHELYHIDPERPGIRRMERADGTCSANCHGQRFFEDVVEMVKHYLDTKPDPEMYDFLQYDFAGLTERYGGVAGTAFRAFPSYPQRYTEVMDPQPRVPGHDDVPRGAVEADARGDDLHRARSDAFASSCRTPRGCSRASARSAPRSRVMSGFSRTRTFRYHRGALWRLAISSATIASSHCSVAAEWASCISPRI